MATTNVTLDELLKRVIALEEKISTSSGWNSGTSSDGKIYWIQEKSTGLLIQFSAGKNYPRNTNITLPKSYKSATSYSLTIGYGINTNNWGPVSSAGTCRIISANQINVGAAEGSGSQFSFICIGY